MAGRSRRGNVTVSRLAADSFPPQLEPHTLLPTDIHPRNRELQQVPRHTSVHPLRIPFNTCSEITGS